MEAKEMMLNDLMLFRNKVCKIVATNNYRDCVEFYFVDDKYNEVVCKYAKHISSIPLTPEILEKNGFVFYTDVPTAARWYFRASKIRIDMRLIMRKTGDEWWFNTTTQSDHNRDTNLDLSCVHEAQHALRLCGLTELADNFLA